LTNKDKALKIINRIVELVNNGYEISFQDDMGGHSLTVGVKNHFDTDKEYTHFHTYGGLKSEYELLDSLYRNLKLKEEETKHSIRDY
jgi:hypothetical protein